MCPAQNVWTVRRTTAERSNGAPDRPGPCPVVTTMGPVAAEAGTAARTVVSETTVNGAVAPAMATDVAPARFEPVIVTGVPGGPLAGKNELTAGPSGSAGATSNIVPQQAPPKPLSDVP